MKGECRMGCEEWMGLYLEGGNEWRKKNCLQVCMREQFVQCVGYVVV